MKIKVADRIAQADAMSATRPTGKSAERFSEWHHFNFNDERNGLYGIFNLALSGNLDDAEQARIGTSLIVCEPGTGWHGTMNMHSASDVKFRPGAVDLRIGESAIRLRNGRYEITGVLKDRSVVLDATWTPDASAIRVDNIGGMINTFILPRLRVDGTIAVEGKSYRLRGASGYHDHNWGNWDWGRDLGWDWGYILQPAGPNGKRPPVSIVFGQVTDATRVAAKSDLVLIVWFGGRCMQVFLDDAVEVETKGYLKGLDVPRVPGVMANLFPLGPKGIPRELHIRARDGDDRVEISMAVQRAMQFLIPHPRGVGSTTISELVGRYRVRGVIEGRALDFSYVGFAELAG